ncbi:MAG: hypothetical protein U0359_05700 [Byssovorax sp.]
MRSRLPRPILLTAAFAAALAALFPRAARADERPTLSGSWTASPLSESWSLSDWGEACGPKPASSGGGGGSVQIREQGGELSILGGGRAFSSAECWEQLPGMSRTSHSASGNGRFWRTRCSNAANDPRHAAVVTTLSATDSSISLSETGEYQFSIQGTTCKATATRSRSYSLVRRDGEEPPAPSAIPSASAPPEKSAKPPPAPPPERPAPRCTGAPGEPSRLEVHPARKVLKPGDRFTFRAVVLDGQGCPVGAKPAFTIVKGPLSDKAQVDGTGTITVAGDAPEGTISLSAAAFGKSVTVTVEVASPEHYDALLGQSGQSGQGEDEPAVAVIATGTIGGKTAVAEDAARERKVLFVSIVALLAAALGFAGLVIARRGRRPLTTPGEEGEPESGDPSSGDALPGEPPSGGAAGDALPGDPAAAGPAAEGPKQGARRKTKVSDRGKICPTCGERYGSDATFCGKDGTTLVLLN